MLSLARFERVNGHAPTVWHNPALGYSAVVECRCGAAPRPIWTSQYFESAASALEDLLEKVLAEHRLITMDNANWACANCGHVTGMAAHHKVLRSRGRDDRVTNLVSLCERCHTQEHGNK
jgi:hypothetical protein